MGKLNEKDETKTSRNIDYQIAYTNISLKTIGPGTDTA